MAPPDRGDSVVIADGGDSACWSHLVCPDCGALENEGHHAGCARAATPAPVTARNDEGLAERHLARRIIVWMILVTPVFAGFFAALCFVAAHMAGVPAGAPAMAGSIVGALAGIFFGMWGGVVASVDELEHSNLVMERLPDSS